MDLRTGIMRTAGALGVDPVDLATAISYETAGTFNPTKRGPTTQWGQHRGLIQFGEPQAKKYGVDWNDPLGSQLGENGAVAKYLRDTGVRPGMGLLDIYSAINAGGVGRYNRSDANNGGAPGTVRDKVEQQMAGHRRKAAELIAADTMAALGQQEQPMGLLNFSTRDSAPAEPEKWWNDDRRARLQMALEGMTLNPNQGIMYAAQQGLKERADTRKDAKLEQQAAERRTRTAEWLAQQGRGDLADAVGRGMIDPKTAVGEAIKPPSDDRTAMAKNYEFLVSQGMSPDEALNAVRSGTNVTVNNASESSEFGEAPKDMVWARDGQGNVVTEEIEVGGGQRVRRPVAVPISGGKTDAERAAEKEAAKNKEAQRLTTADIVLEDIDRVLNEVENGGMPVTGTIGVLGRGIPGTAQSDTARTLDTIKANVGFDKLQSMRDASPTGGALGQVSEMENRLLQSVLGNLEQSQSQEQFTRNLTRLKQVYLDIIHGPGNWSMDDSKVSVGDQPKQGNRLKWNPDKGDFE